MSPEMLQAVLIVGGILLVILLIWLLSRSGRKTKIVGESEQSQDVLDEGSAPASRNQALIDAPSSTIETKQAPAPEVDTSPTPVAVPTAAATSAPTPTPTPTPTAEADDLRRIKGVGPKLVTMLADQGITSFEQIAAWSDDDVTRVDATLGRFAGRITRDKWIDQAKLLTTGEDTEFSNKFGKNG